MNQRLCDSLLHQSSDRRSFFQKMLAWRSHAHTEAPESLEVEARTGKQPSVDDDARVGNKREEDAAEKRDALDDQR